MLQQTRTVPWASATLQPMMTATKQIKVLKERHATLLEEVRFEHYNWDRGTHIALTLKDGTRHGWEILAVGPVVNKLLFDAADRFLCQWY